VDIAAAKSKSTSRLTLGYLICVSAAICWSFTGILIRYLTVNYHIPPLTLAFWRDLFMVLALTATFALANPERLHLERRHWSFFVLFGFEVSLFNSLWTISVALNGAAVATVLAYSSVAFTAVLGRWLLHERLNSMKVLAVTLCLLGCVFVSGAYAASAWQINPVGIVTGLLSGLAFAGYSLMGRVAGQRGVNPWTTLNYSFILAVPFLLAYNLFARWLPAGTASTQFFWLGGAVLGWALLVFLSIGPTIGGFGLYSVGLTYLPASVANLIATLEPVMTAIMAFILLGERLSAPQWFGSALVIGGVIIIRLSEGR